MIITVDFPYELANRPDLTQKDILRGNYTSGLVLGKLVVDNNQPIDLNIREIDTLCGINPAARLDKE